MSIRIQTSIFYGVLSSLVFLIAISCSSSSGTDDELTLSGIVQESTSDEPVDSALVEVLKPEELSRYSYTNSNGKYSFGFEVTEPTDVELQASKAGYITENQTIRVAPESNASGVTFTLSTPSDTTDSGNGEKDDDDTSEPSKGSAYITLTDVSSSEIRVSGAGGVETSQLTFTVTDSSGTPIDNDRAEYVNFEILQGPGDASIYPDSALTQNGEATATVKSGTEAGVVQVMASFTRNTAVQKSFSQKERTYSTQQKQTQRGHLSDNTTDNVSSINSSNTNTRGAPSIQEIITHESKPVSISITGGLPVQEHFEMYASTNNMVAADNNTSAVISVDLADKYGNTVPEGTAVQFKTDLGSLDGSGTTDSRGVATNQLQPGQPGMATITAETVDETSQTISKQVQVLFSGSPQLSVSPQSLSLDGFTKQTFTYTLQDENGYPLAAGTSVSVSVDNENLALSGDTNITLEDIQASGEGTTEFSFTLSNPNQVSFSSSSTLTISSEGPNGSITEQIELLPPNIDPASPGSITLASISNDQIGVKETGQQESTDLTFQVTDLNGQPLNLENAVEVSFSLGASPNGGEQLSPSTASTDGDGQVTTTLTSGTTSGVVQVVASLTANGNTISSQPVSVAITAGLPVQNNFNIKVDDGTQNMVAESSDKVQLTAYVGDKHGNPVPEGTAIAFTTDRGIITSPAQTNASGEATATYTASGSAGTATIQASTANSSQQTITDNVELLLSGTPSLSVSPSSVDLTSFQSESFTLTLADENGNPLAAGTSVSVSVDNENLSLSGDTDITLVDAQTSGEGTTEFSFTLSNPSGLTIYQDGIVSISTTGPNGSVNQEVTLNAPDSPAITPGSITLASVSNSEIGVVSTGQTEQTQLTFQVTDSTGQPLNGDNTASVSFSFGSRPSGADIKPATATTDANGQVSTILTSGTGAGVAQVIAEVDGTTIKSQPAAVTIHAGLPDEGHFTISRSQKNIIYNEDDQPAKKMQLTAYAGDVHNNTVPEGTPIYFRTDGGFIGGSAQTNAEGEATVTLTAKKKFPPNGVATITAETADDNGQTISDDVQVIFSVADPQISTGTNSIDLGTLQSENVNYTVLDPNGNPLPEGSTISVTVDNQDLVLSGDTQVTIPDAFSTGSGASNFSFTISNPNNIDIYEDGSISIVATAPDVDGALNSNESTIPLSAPDAPPLNPGNITVSNISTNEIGVVSTGQTEQTQLTFQVTDSLGRALDLDNQTEVRFSLGASPGGGEDLSPKVAMTDGNGEATTTLTGGTSAGVAQVVAEVTASDGTIINSQPVSVTIHAGLPDQNHFSLASSTNNVAANTGTEVTLTAYVGDKYGNVVAPGTSVYFTTDGGYITASAQTDQNGIANATLRAVSPTPGDGMATITASTADDQQNKITAIKDIIFSGGPSITVTPSSINMPNDANTTFNYSVEDGNGYPMVFDTKISVTVEGNEIETIGDVEITIDEPNNSFNNISQLTDFQFNIADAAGDTVVTDPVQITITSEGPNGTARTTISGTKNKGSR